jgi:hypothetical protein
MATSDPTKEPHDQIQFRQLLEEAVTKPGAMMPRLLFILELQPW